MLKKLLLCTLLFTSVLSDELKLNNKMKNAYESIQASIALLPDAQQKIIKDEVLKEYQKYYSINNQKSPITIFYFADSNITSKAFERFSLAINKINITGKVVFRGLINGSFTGSANFLKEIKKDNNIKNIDFFPIHFHSFEYFNLNEVPAYALSICNNEQFRFSDCDHKYLIRGDISLRDFFEILNNYTNEYERYYHILKE